LGRSAAGGQAAQRKGRQELQTSTAGEESMKTRFYVNLIVFPLALVVAGYWVFIALKRGNTWAWLVAAAMSYVGLITLYRIVAELREKAQPSRKPKEDTGSE
jgi:hypothetical protein